MKTWDFNNFNSFIKFVDSHANDLSLSDPNIKEKFFSYLKDYVSNVINVLSKIPLTKEEGKKIEMDFKYAHSYVGMFFSVTFEDKLSLDISRVKDYIKNVPDDVVFVGFDSLDGEMVTTKKRFPNKSGLDIFKEDIKLDNPELTYLFLFDKELIKSIKKSYALYQS